MPSRRMGGLLCFILPLFVYARNLHIDAPGTSSTVRDEGTNTMDKRAPSAYPYGDPFPGEFQYVNWDPNDDDQKQRAEKIHAAFGEWKDLVYAASQEAENPNSASLTRWAGTDAASNFEKMFGAMWNADTNSPAAAVAQMSCDEQDFTPARNTPSTNAYTVPSTGQFYVTQASIDKRLNINIRRDDLDNSASANMRSLAMTLVHEMTHFQTISDSIGKATDDIASGSYDCFKLDSDVKTFNAQNYAWFAGEAYFTKKFNIEFIDPSKDVRSEPEVPSNAPQSFEPVSTTERTVGEDEAPQANFAETSPTFSYMPACYGGGSNPFTQGEAASAIKTFCSSSDWVNLAIVPKVSYGDIHTSSGHVKMLDIKDNIDVNHGATTLWMDISFAKSSCMGVSTFNATDCNLQLNNILNGCDTSGDYPKHGGWIRSSGSPCVVYRLIPQAKGGPDPLYVQASDGEMGAWTCVDTPTVPGVTSLAGTCTCYFQWQASVTDLFVKPSTSGGCADIRQGTSPMNN